MQLLCADRREVNRNSISQPTLFHHPRTHQCLRVQFQLHLIRIVFKSLQTKSRRVFIWIGDLFRLFRLFRISEVSSAVIASFPLLVLAEANELIIIKVDGFSLTRLCLFLEQLRIYIRRRTITSLEDRCGLALQLLRRLNSYLLQKIPLPINLKVREKLLRRKNEALLAELGASFEKGKLIDCSL